MTKAQRGGEVCAPRERAKEAEMIEREVVSEMFAQMREEGIDTDQDLLWGYFFAHSEPEALEKLGEEMERRGYEVIEIFEPEPEEDDENEEPYFLLQVERLETHTLDTLDQRNREFDKLAEEFGIDAYDGMEVGLPGDESSEEPN